VVHPPVELDRFRAAPVGDGYLVLSELMRHKRIDVAIEAFNRLRRPLVIVGNGPDERRLRRLAGPTVRFEGRVSDARAAELFARSRALVVTATEEFGIAAVEAQAAGRPVIALAEGGVHETILEGETGAFYSSPEAEALMAAVAGFDALGVDPAACRANAERFDVGHFRHGLRAVVDEACASPRAERRRRPARGLVLSE
jgi:glycosyltransferase involved in cell wall biosynthesis